MSEQGPARRPGFQTAAERQLRYDGKRESIHPVPILREPASLGATSGVEVAGEGIIRARALEGATAPRTGAREYGILQVKHTRFQEDLNRFYGSRKQGQDRKRMERSAGRHSDLRDFEAETESAQTSPVPPQESPAGAVVELAASGDPANEDQRGESGRPWARRSVWEEHRFAVRSVAAIAVQDLT